MPNLKFKISKELEPRHLLIGFVLILLIGGIGGALMERLILPYLSTWLNYPRLSPQAPIMITKREEIRIDEGINQADLVNRLKGGIVTVYLHDGNFHVLAAVSGIFMTSDGLIAAPLNTGRSAWTSASVTILDSNGANYSARVAAVDHLTGLVFLKIDGQNFPLIKQGFGSQVGAGDKLLTIWSNENSASPSAAVSTAAASPMPSPSLLTSYDLTQIVEYLPMNGDTGSAALGGAVVDRDGQLVGLVTQNSRGTAILSSDVLKIALDNFLDDESSIWPALPKISYLLLSEGQSPLLGLPAKFGALIKGNAGALHADDFVIAVDGKPLSQQENLQTALLRKKPGDSVKLQVIRSGREIEITINL